MAVRLQEILETQVPVKAVITQQYRGFTVNILPNPGEDEGHDMGDLKIATQPTPSFLLIKNYIKVVAIVFLTFTKWQQISV